MTCASLAQRMQRVRARLLPAGSLGARLAYGTIWSGAGSAAAQGLTLIAMIVAARLLGKTAFGQYSMVYSTVGLFALFAGFGLPTTASKYIAEFREKDLDRAGQVLGLTQLTAWVSGALFCVALYAAAPLLAARVLDTPDLAPYLRVGAAWLLFAVLHETQAGVFYGLEAFQTMAFLRLLRGVLVLPLLVFGTMRYGIGGAVGATAIGTGICYAAGVVALRRLTHRHGFSSTFHGLSRVLPILWHFAVPALLTCGFMAPAMWAANAMLVNRPDGYAEMAVFNASNQWRMALAFIPMVLVNVNTPVLSSLYGAGNLADCRRVLIRTVQFSGAVTIPLAIILIVFANPIVALYGEEFAGEGQPLMILAIAGILAAFMFPVGQAVTASGRMWLGMWMTSGWAVVLLGSAFLFLRAGMGARGLALAYVAAFCVHATWTFAFAVRFVQGRITPRHIMPAGDST